MLAKKFGRKKKEKKNHAYYVAGKKQKNVNVSTRKHVTGIGHFYRYVLMDMEGERGKSEAFMSTILHNRPLIALKVKGKKIKRVRERV